MRSGITSLGIKELVDAISLCRPLTYVQRYLLRGTNWDTGCLACFASNPMPLKSGVSALLSQTFISPNMVTPFPRRPDKSPPHQVPKCGVLKVCRLGVEPSVHCVAQGR